MQEKKLLRRFRLRLLWQALIRCGIWGAAAGCGALFVCSLVWHILLRAPSVGYLVGSFALGFLVGMTPVLIKHFPTWKRTAKALDDTGLQERAGTMLAFKDKDGLLVQLQRKDAAAHIESATQKSLKLGLGWKPLAILGVSAALCVTMVALPHDLFAPPPEQPPELTAWEQHVHSQIDALRQQIRDSQLSAEAQAELEAILAQLEQDLLNTDNELEQAALIQEAQEAMQDVIYNTISRRVIGRALQQYDLTVALGAQLCVDDNYWEIHEQMEQLKRDISGPTKQLSRLGNNINNALEISGVDSGDALYGALAEMAKGLIDMSNYTIGPDDDQGWTMSDLDFLFEVSEEAIRLALEQQAHDEAEVANMDAMITDTMQSLSDGEATESAGKKSGQQQGGKGNDSPGGGGDGDASGTPVGGLFDSGDSNSQGHSMLEGVYDPLSGDVPYGDVFAVYYAEYLKALDAGEIPEELRPYFERYFSSLS